MGGSRGPRRARDRPRAKLHTLCPAPMQVFNRYQDYKADKELVIIEGATVGGWVGRVGGACGWVRGGWVGRVGGKVGEWCCWCVCAGREGGRAVRGRCAAPPPTHPAIRLRPRAHAAHPPPPPMRRWMALVTWWS